MKKNINKSILSLILIIVLIASTLVGCGGDSSNVDTGNDNGEETNAEEKVLVVAYDKDAETLDHLKTSWFSDSLIYIFDRLVSRDYDFNYEPGLAKKWDVTDDGLVWTFYLKEGVKFHDGKELTAEDVKWTIDTIKDPDTASPSQSDFAPIKEVVVKGDYEFDIKLDGPFPNLLFILSGTSSGIASKEAYEKYGEDYGNKKVIGTGPYIFEEWIKGDKIVLTKNPEYDWGPDWMQNNGAPIIDKIIMRVIPEENSRMMELEAGNVNILRDVTAVVGEKLKSNENIEILTGESPQLGYLAYATDKEPFTDIRVRRAINHALNKEEIIKYVFRDAAIPAHGYLPPMLTEEYYPDSKKDGYDYDVEAAKSLLKEAGYGDGLKLKLGAENSTEFSRLAEVIQTQLKEVGIDAEIQLYDSASYTAMLKEGKQELFIREYSWLNADILDWFLLSTQFPFPNHSRWQDEKTDELLNGAATMATWEERAEGYRDVQKYLIEQAVWAPIYIPEHSVAINKKVKNFKYHPWVIQFNDGIDIDTK